MLPNIGILKQYEQDQTAQQKKAQQIMDIFDA